MNPINWPRLILTASLIGGAGELFTIRNYSQEISRIKRNEPRIQQVQQLEKELRQELGYTSDPIKAIAMYESRPEVVNKLNEYNELVNNQEIKQRLAEISELDGSRKLALGIGSISLFLSGVMWVFIGSAGWLERKYDETTKKIRKSGGIR
ncbi:hypothetical protein HY450_03440 [Candidatus Pacearchaeota archaeon]|nr:hypothetical protein [Candidatus Pacearchaeota archaeon]